MLGKILHQVTSSLKSKLLQGHQRFKRLRAWLLEIGLLSLTKSSLFFLLSVFVSVLVCYPNIQAYRLDASRLVTYNCPIDTLVSCGFLVLSRLVPKTRVERLLLASTWQLETLWRTLTYADGKRSQRAKWSQQWWRFPWPLMVVVWLYG